MRSAVLNKLRVRFLFPKSTLQYKQPWFLASIIAAKQCYPWFLSCYFGLLYSQVQSWLLPSRFDAARCYPRTQPNPRATAVLTFWFLRRTVSRAHKTASLAAFLRRALFATLSSTSSSSPRGLNGSDLLASGLSLSLPAAVPSKPHRLRTSSDPAALSI